MRISGCMALLTLTCLLQVYPTHAADPLENFGTIVPGNRTIAPDFSLPALHGDAFTLADHRGKVVFLNFWATWCAPCREELPSMQRLWETFRDRDLVMIAVATDGRNERGVSSLTENLGLTYPILLDREDRLRDRYDVIGLPVTYIIHRDGSIAGRIVAGRDWGSPEAAALIEHLLDQRDSPATHPID